LDPVNVLSPRRLHQRQSISVFDLAGHRNVATYNFVEQALACFVADDIFAATWAEGQSVALDDIVAEVQKAVSTLERQARRAEQFNEVRTRLRTLEIELMEREYAQLVGRSTPVEERLRSLNEDSSRIDTDLSGEESRLESLRNRMLESEKRLAEAQRDVSLQREAMHQVEESNAVAAERMMCFSEVRISRIALA